MVGTRVATGLFHDEAGVDACAEAAARAAAGLGGAADLALVFAGPGNFGDSDEGIEAVCDQLRPRVLLGCGAQGVVADGRELESGGVAIWAASFPGGEVEPFALELQPGPEGDSLAVAGVPDLDGADAVILLADPYRFPVEPVLSKLCDAHPGLPVVGGLASGGPGAGALLADRGPADAGAVGVVLRGVEVRACVSQGARPIGPEMAVTAAEGNVIHELASRPALERLREAIAELDAAEQALAVRGLLLGVVIDPNKPDYERGDFLIRGLTGVDEESGSLSVGTTARVGQTVRMQVRDAASAHEDLLEALDRQSVAMAGPPAGALLFTCNGRGSQMFGTRDHDAGLVREALGAAPTAGFFCAGEIGPVGSRSFVHGFTATVALFPR